MMMPSCCTGSFFFGIIAAEELHSGLIIALYRIKYV